MSAGWCNLCGRLHELGTSACSPSPSIVVSGPYTCPVCTGQGRVTRPPHVAGDIPVWASSGTELYDCRACKGTGIVWRP